MLMARIERERGRENSSFPVEEGGRFDRWKTVGFQRVRFSLPLFVFSFLKEYCVRGFVFLREEKMFRFHQHRHGTDDRGRLVGIGNRKTCECRSDLVDCFLGSNFPERFHREGCPALREEKEDAIQEGT